MDLLYFKLTLFDITEFIVLNIRSTTLGCKNISGLEIQSSWQRLNFFVILGREWFHFQKLSKAIKTLTLNNTESDGLWGHINLRDSEIDSSTTENTAQCALGWELLSLILISPISISAASTFDLRIYKKQYLSFELFSPWLKLPSTSDKRYNNSQLRAENFRSGYP